MKYVYLVSLSIITAMLSKYTSVIGSQNLDNLTIKSIIITSYSFSDIGNNYNSPYG
jgi:hypothetical protein